MHSVILVTLCASFALGNTLVTREDKTPVDDDTYQRLVYYVGFEPVTADLANGTCPDPSNGAQLVQYININSTDTQAALWKSTSREELILSIPGTASLEDAFTDLDLLLVDFESPNVNCAGGCLVHQGFLDAWNSLEPVAAEAITTALAEYPDYSTVISGHSLGAGIAALAFASLVNGPYNISAAYTYGQPRTGNQAFADYIDSLSGASDDTAGNYYRVTHYNDSIPQLPPTILGWRHSRTEYWESAYVANESTTYRCYGQEPVDCNNSLFAALGILDNPAHSTYAGFSAVTCD